MGYINIHSNVYVAYDEQDLEDALNGATLTPSWGVKAKGNRLVFAQQDSGVIISTEAQAVLDRMTGLTATEETAIINFVNEESASLGNGNWALIDEFYCFSLGLTNNLIGFLSKTATNNGAVLDINGATFNGTSDFISSEFNPSIDGVNYQLLNAQGEAYVKEAPSDTAARHLFGAFDATQRIRVQSSTTVNAAINSNTNVSKASPVESNKLVSITRGGSNVRYLEDGAEVSAITNTALALPNAIINVGNSSGLAGNFFQGTISSFMVGASVGFDQAAHNTNLRAFLTELGTLP